MARNRRSAAPRVVPLQEAPEAELRGLAYGAPAVALAVAQRAGLPVAPCWLVSAQAFRDELIVALPPDHDPSSLIRSVHRPVGVERAARARERLLEHALDPELSAELAQLCAAEVAESNSGFSVRASPTCAAAVAARAPALLQVVHAARGPAALESAVRRVWSALVDEEALSVLRAERVKEISLGLILQRLGACEASGVARFCPAGATETGSPEEVLVVAAFGVGAVTVDGQADRDVYRCTPAGDVVERRVANKADYLGLGVGGVDVRSAAAPRALRPALSDALLLRIAQVVVRAQGLGLGARAVEFVVERRGGLAIVALPADVHSGGSSRAWTRAGFGESLPGVPTPLTWSLGRRFSEAGLRHALHALGAELPRDARPVERIWGRPYLDLSQLLPIVAALPGLDPSSLLAAVDHERAADLGRALGVRPRRPSIASLSLVAARLASHSRHLGSDVGEFGREADAQQRWLGEMDLAILPDDALGTTLRESYAFYERTGRLLSRAALLALACHSALESVLLRSLPVTAERVEQVITAGVGDLDTAASGVALAHVAAILRKDPEASRALSSGAALRPSDLPQGAGRRAVAHFLEGYGDRAIRESEIAVPRWREDPAPVLAMLASSLSGDAQDPEDRLSLVRVEADRALGALEASVTRIELLLIRTLIGRCREFVRLRERMRVWMARTLGMLRVVALDLDRRLRRIDRGLEPGAVFFCTAEELVSAAGRLRADLGPLTRFRRAGHERHAALPDPPDAFLGPVPPLVAPPRGDTVLHGAPASPGVVTGVVRHVGPRGRGLARVQRGDVIVVYAPDVSLAPSLLCAGALVGELGTKLSHLAVVAREYGTAAVLGVPAASVSLRDGERVAVDGGRGVIERLDG